MVPDPYSTDTGYSTSPLLLLVLATVLVRYSSLYWLPSGSIPLLVLAERDREIHTERQRKKARERETDRQTDRQRQTEAERQ